MRTALLSDLARLGLLALALLAGCGDDDKGSILDYEPPPPGVACSPREGADPEPSFDPSHVPCVEITIEPEAWELLAAQNRFGIENEEEAFFEAVLGFITDCSVAIPKAYEWFSATVTVDGHTLEQVGVRKKGFVGSVWGQGLDKPSLKVKADKYVEDQAWGDTENLTFNNNISDRTGVRTCVAFEVFRAAGVAAPRCNLANVMVNGEAMGAYVHVEPVKKAFLRRAFGRADGHLYEGTMADFHPDFLGPFPGGHLGHWEVKTDDTDPEGGPLRALSEALEAPDDTLLEALGPVLDVDLFLTFWAVELLINHGDGYANDRNNFYLYVPPQDGRAFFIPWGVDKVLASDVKDEDALVGGRSPNGELTRRLSRLPAVRARLEDELRRLLDEVWDETRLLEMVDTLGAQVAAAQEDPGQAEALDELRAWIRGRRRAVEEALAVGLNAGRAARSGCLVEE